MHDHHNREIRKGDGQQKMGVDTLIIQLNLGHIFGHRFSSIVDISCHLCYDFNTSARFWSIWWYTWVRGHTLCIIKSRIPPFCRNKHALLIAVLMTAHRLFKYSPNDSTHPPVGICTYWEYSIFHFRLEYTLWRLQVFKITSAYFTSDHTNTDIMKCSRVEREDKIKDAAS